MSINAKNLYLSIDLYYLLSTYNQRFTENIYNLIQSKDRGGKLFFETIPYKY
ncbi:hypothetical protein M595_1823 [Lyngbya aestuarii BL J]|uniref:Uncharacterized protein n=1 Tax=Lyngbya aestuarii BL J TaxID=1348334 RepID=U7QK04_9CYAN|nr:hypothetical protein M595_1823 [Lyngbya aestuarii BL J]